MRLNKIWHKKGKKKKVESKKLIQTYFGKVGN